MKPTELELNLLPLIQEEQIRGENLGTVRIEKQKLTEAEKQLKLLESVRLRVAKKTKPVQTLNQQAEEVRSRIGAVQETLNGKKPGCRVSKC